jgi:outer membrane protein assembly factor BamB
MASTLAAGALLLVCFAGVWGPFGPSVRPHHGSGRFVVFANTSLPGPAWPEFHATPNLTGYSPNSSLNASNAGTLGVAWASDLYGAALDSPVVAFDGVLGTYVVYVGTETGNLLALRASDGSDVWSTWLGSPLRAAPVVSNGSVYVATFSNPEILKLNATTGAVECAYFAPAPIEGSPVVVTPPGGNSTLYVGTLDSGSSSGPFLAVRTGNCTLEWSFTRYRSPTGSWDGVSYAVNATGTPMVLFGTSDPDSTVYALNALNGTKLWNFSTYDPPPSHADVAAGVTVSAPGAIGFSDGVGFTDNKDGFVYALNLSDGNASWNTSLGAAIHATGQSRSTPALAGTNLVLGYGEGLVDLNATNGQVRWHYQDPTASEVLSSPAVAGPPGAAVAVAGDVGGSVEVVNATSGALLWTYSTGAYITASPAVVGGEILLPSANGFLYAFAAGAGLEANPPSAAIDYPVDQAALANPNGNLTVSGAAADGSGVSEVRVAVQSGGVGGPWWDAATHAWLAGPIDNRATLASPGNNSTNWTFHWPVPSGGGSFVVTAYSSSLLGPSDVRPAQVAFSVLYSTKGPHVRLSAPYAAPGGGVSVTGGGFLASEPITIQLGGLTLRTVNATSKGALPYTRIVVPKSDPFGPYAVTATGVTSGRSASAPLTVANSWGELGEGPTRTGFDPNDLVLNGHVDVGDDTWLDLAWHFDGGSAVRASPIVAGGVAYLATTGGSVFALDTTNAGELWTWTAPGSEPLWATPDLNGAAHRIYVAGTNGTLDALATSDGRLLWNDTLPGNLTSPAVAGGLVVLGSSSGAIYAISETNGSIVWSNQTGEPIAAPTAVDAPANLVVVAETNGSVAAFHLSNGSLAWNRTMGGPLTASPLISGGLVFVDSVNRSVTALTETNGALKWTASTGGTIAGAPAYSNQGTGGGADLFVGASNGDIYVFSATTGSIRFVIAVRSAVVGVAAADGVVVFETLGGNIGAARTYTNLVVWDHSLGRSGGSAPIVLDGSVYTTDLGGYLSAFTTFGQPPD